jgi:hypothetical protein
LKITQIIEKINQITFYFVEEGPGHASEDIKKEHNVNCFDFFFCTKIEKEETHAHRKRARSALSTERKLEL